MLFTFLMVAMWAAIASAGNISTIAPAVDTIIDLNETSGVTTVDYSGYNWTVFRLKDVQPHSAVDVMVTVERGCSAENMIVSAELVPDAIPTILPNDVTSIEGESDRKFLDYLTPLFQSNFLCTLRPSAGFSNKDTGNNVTEWYIRTQTTNVGASLLARATADCHVQVYWSVMPMKSIEHQRSVSGLVLVIFFSALTFALLPTLLSRHFDINTPARWRYTQFVIAPITLATWCIIRLGTAAVEHVRSSVRKASRRGVVLAARGGEMRSAATETPSVLKDDTELSQLASPTAPERTDTGASDATNEEISCRICKESDEQEDLIRPCECSGSVAFIHRSCLDRWRITAAQQNTQFINTCEICRKPFSIPIDRSSLYRAMGLRLAKFAVIIFVSYWIMVITSASAHLILGPMCCSAPFHTIDLIEPFALRTVMVGLCLYYMFSLAAFLALHFAWLSHCCAAADAGVSPTAGGFCSIRTVYYTLVVVAWELVVVLLVSLVSKVILYNSSDFFLWTDEVNLAGGIVVTGLFLVPIVCIIIMVYVVLSRRQRNTSNGPLDTNNETNDTHPGPAGLLEGDSATRHLAQPPVDDSTLDAARENPAATSDTTVNVNQAPGWPVDFA
jgi:hypothetical protein